MNRHTPRKGSRRSDLDGIRLLTECLRHTAAIAPAVASTIQALITMLGCCGTCVGVWAQSHLRPHPGYPPAPAAPSRHTRLCPGNDSVTVRELARRAAPAAIAWAPRFR